MTIADRIRERRIELQLSQTDLAKRMGYSDKTSVSKIETSGNNVSAKKIKRAADALNVSMAYLYGWEEPNHAEDNERRLARLTKYAEYLHILDKYMELSERDKQTVSTLIDTLSK